MMGSRRELIKVTLQLVKEAKNFLRYKADALLVLFYKSAP